MMFEDFIEIDIAILLWEIVMGAAILELSVMFTPFLITWMQRFFFHFH
jgi:hypothetical protein